MPTVGYASLQVIPSVEGIAGRIREQLVGPAEDAGDEAGSGFAKRMAAGLALGVAGAGALVGGLLVKGISGAIEQQQIAGKLGAQLGATGADAQRYGKLAGQLYAAGVTEDIQGAADAIRATMSAGLVPPDATNKQIQSIAANVHDLSDTFELDLGQSTNAIGQLMKNGLATNAKEALDVMTRGLQVMGPRADDLADTFNEYSPIFKSLGLSAQTATGLLSQGMKAGARDTDVVADALKEFQIRATDGSTASAAGFKALGLSAKGMTEQIAKGGAGASAGLQTVLDRLKGVKDPVERNAAAVALFGTKAEDLAGALFSLDPKTAVAGLGQVAGAADRMGASLRDNAGARIEAFKRGLEQGLVNVVGGRLLPVLERGASFLADRFGPAFGQAADWVRTSVAPAAGELAHRIADDLIPAFSAAASWASDHLVPAAAGAAHWLRDDFAPAALTVARVIKNDVIPGIRDSVGWLNRNKQSIAIVAGVITTLLLPVLITTAVGYAQAGTAATISKIQQVSAWVSTGTAAVASGARQVAASYVTVGGWIRSGAAAVVSAAQQVGAWVAMGARALWGMALQAGAAAAVVAGWVLMGVQSLIQAARMAAAWVLAMGPVGWIIAAVVALAALIILNWEKIKTVTVAVFTAVVDWIKGAAAAVLGWLQANWPLLLAILTGPIGIAVLLIVRYWDQITAGFRAAYQAVVSVGQSIVSWVAALPGRILAGLANLGTWLYNLARDAFTRFLNAQAALALQVIDLVRGLPGRITSALGNLGNLLYDKGGDVVRGMWAGIQSMGGWLRDKLIGFAKAIIPGPIAKALGINSPSKVMAREVGRWIPAGIIAGIESGAPALERTMANLVQPARPPAWMLPTAATVGAPALAATIPASLGTGAAIGGSVQPLNIENYWESEGGNARKTAVELQALSKGRG